MHAMRSAPTRLQGLVLEEHVFELPLDHDAPGRGTLEVFAREVVAAEREAQRGTLPWLVFLQGGPGFGAPRPMSNAGWIRRATKDHRVLLLDQRGTGRSTPVSAQSLAHLADAREQAAYLRCFRADSIVRDCEAIRRTLLGPGERWKVLGQSYGGFCAVTYLSSAPEGLSGALITGGLPPLDAHPDEIYRRTYRLVAQRNRAYYERYPGDRARAAAIAHRLERGDVRMPDGDVLSVRRFQSLGLQLGFSDGMELLHYLMEEAFVPGRGEEELAYVFLRGCQNLQHFDTNPIYSILQEACYTQGFASDWSAQRVRAEFPDFDDNADEPFFFTGEMVYPWMFEEIGALRPLREAAELLARAGDWPRLYERQALARNEVPCAAAVYYDDMFVEREHSLEAAAAIRGLKPWITNEYEHNGLRADGERLLDRLLEMLAR